MYTTVLRKRPIGMVTIRCQNSPRASQLCIVALFALGCAASSAPSEPPSETARALLDRASQLVQRGLLDEAEALVSVVRRGETKGRRKVLAEATNAAADIARYRQQLPRAYELHQEALAMQGQEGASAYGLLSSFTTTLESTAT